MCPQSQCTRSSGIRYPERGQVVPLPQRFGCPVGRLVAVTYRAGIRHLQVGRILRCDEFERVRPDVHVSELSFDFRHVARNAFVSRAAGFVVSMRLKRCHSMRAIRRFRPMAFETEDVPRLEEVRIVVRAMNVVATEAGYPAGVHDALDEVVSLHSIFVSRTIGEMRKGLFAELIVFKLPVNSSNRVPRESQRASRNTSR